LFFCFEMPVTTKFVAKFSTGATGSGGALAIANGDLDTKPEYRSAGKAFGMA
jgi:hypothetical protein